MGIFEKIKKANGWRILMVVMAAFPPSINFVDEDAARRDFAMITDADIETAINSGFQRWEE